MDHNKIIFTGPVGAGKTTAINALSDIPTVVTDARATDMAAGRKAGTTVALDYGLMKLPGEERIHLYGTPGQERFDFMWDILTEGGIGLVLLVDNTRPEPFRDLKFFLRAFDKFIGSTSLVIGVTRMDLKGTPTLEEYHQQLYGVHFKPPVFEVDARERRDVALLVQALLYTLDPGLHD
jgi:signal recognition particle receptor subunit beta